MTRMEENGKQVLYNVIHGEVKMYISTLTTEFNKLEDTTFKDNDHYFKVMQNTLKNIISCPENDIQIITDMQAVKKYKDFTRLLKESVGKLAPTIVESVLKHDGKRTVLGGSDPDELLADKVLGCPARCPFCTAPCCMTVIDHECDHRSLQHYPTGVVGRHSATTLKLRTATCQSAVGSENRFRYDHNKDVYEPYSDYRKHFPKWDIAPDRSMEASLYWKWFMATYHDKLVKQYEVKHADLPAVWKEITAEQAIQSLENIENKKEVKETV